jgi:hypothetical protein
VKRICLLTLLEEGIYLMETNNQHIKDLLNGLVRDEEICNKLMKVIKVLESPESSDEIYWCIGELETIVKDLK